MTIPTRVVGERHLLPSRMAVSLAFAFEVDPPPVLICALNKDGHTIATAPMNWHAWRVKYITQRMVRR